MGLLVDYSKRPATVDNGAALIATGHRPDHPIVQVPQKSLPSLQISRQKTRVPECIYIKPRERRAKISVPQVEDEIPEDGLFGLLIDEEPQMVSFKLRKSLKDRSTFLNFLKFHRSDSEWSLATEQLMMAEEQNCPAGQCLTQSCHTIPGATNSEIEDHLEKKSRRNTLKRTFEGNQSIGNLGLNASPLSKSVRDESSNAAPMHIRRRSSITKEEDLGTYLPKALQNNHENHRTSKRGVQRNRSFVTASRIRRLH